MNWDLFDNLLANGTQVAVLVVIPMVALGSGIAMAVAVLTRRGTVATAAVMTSIVVGSVALALDGTASSVIGGAGAVGSLVTLLPIALAVGAALGALPAVGRGMTALVELAHRRSSARILLDGRPAPVELPLPTAFATASVDEVVAA